MLLDSQKDDNRVVGSTKGLVFYGVPHQGSSLTLYGTTTKYISYPSIEVSELSRGSVLNLYILITKIVILNMSTCLAGVF